MDESSYPRTSGNVNKVVSFLKYAGYFLFNLE
jgi:hypothetical protein